MRKFAICYLLFAICAFAPVAHAAVTIKKAAPVATQPSAGTQGAASLLPSVLGLVTGVMEMNARQNALTADCIPTTAEMAFVDNAMKEWAKTGQTTADAMKTLLKREPCDGVDCYEGEIRNGPTPGLDPRYNRFTGAGDKYMPWYEFPKTGIGTYCKDGSQNCGARDRTTVTDTYDLFALIDFGPADYLPGEATMAARMLNKILTCSHRELSARKKALWGEFLVNTAGSLGQRTNTGSIMETVGTVIQNGPAGGIGSIGSIAQQFLAK
jgi:hypothetical protein